MPKQLIKTIEAGEQLTFSCDDWEVFEIQTVTTTRNNRIKIHREVWLRNLENGQEKMILLYNDENEFRLAVGQILRIMNTGWVKGTFEKVLRALGGDKDKEVIQAFKNMQTSQEYMRMNYFNDWKFPLAWIPSLAIGFVVLLIMEVVFRPRDHSNAWFAAFGVAIAVRIAFAIAKFIKYGDVQRNIDQAAKEFFH